MEIKVLLILIVGISVIVAINLLPRNGSSVRRVKEKLQISGSVNKNNYHVHQYDSIAMIVLGAILLGIIGKIHIMYLSNKKKRKEYKIMAQYIKRYHSQSCSLTKGQCQQQAISFSNNTYQMIYNKPNDNHQVISLITVTSIEKQNDRLYNITMDSCGEVEHSQFKGIILFVSDGMGLFVFKQYNFMKTPKIQNMNIQIISYEGQQITQNKWSGKWTYSKHKLYNTPIVLSQTWQMSKIR